MGLNVPNRKLSGNYKDVAKIIKTNAITLCTVIMGFNSHLHAFSYVVIIYREFSICFDWCSHTSQRKQYSPEYANITIMWHSRYASAF